MEHIINRIDTVYFTFENEMNNRYFLHRVVMSLSAQIRRCNKFNRAVNAEVIDISLKDIWDFVKGYHNRIINNIVGEAVEMNHTFEKIYIN